MARGKSAKLKSGFCPLYEKCGGCSLQHIPYDEQVEMKKRRLERILTTNHANSTNLANELIEVEVVRSPEIEFRNRFSFHALRANRGPRVGFMARKTNEIVPVADCPIAVPALRRLLAENALLPPPGKDRFTVYAHSSPTDEHGFTQMNMKEDKGDEIVLAENGASVQIDGTAHSLPQCGDICILGKTVRIDASVFFQSNQTMLEKLLPVLRVIAEGAASRSAQTAGAAGKMADFYAGAGTFSIFLADLFAGADLVEQNRAALEIAKVNLRKNPAVRFFAQNDDEWAKRNSSSNKIIYSFAIVDPPRQGLSRSLAEWLAQKGPPALAYLSCEPSSLERDLGILREAYQLTKLTMFDFYPHTEHIETLAVLEK
jgi:23S rRNA (uracil1939-C5)-methyltransferase